MPGSSTSSGKSTMSGSTSRKGPSGRSSRSGTTNSTTATAMSQVIMVRNRCDISPAVADEIRKAHEESLALLALNEISRPTECIVVARTPTSTDYLVGCALFVLSVSTAKAITMVIVVCGVVLVLYINQQGTTDVKAVDISPERFQQWLNDFSSVDAIVDLSLPVQSVKTIEITNAKNRVLLAEAERLAVAHCEANTCKAIYDPGEQVSIEQLQALKEDPLGSRAQDRAVFEETKRLAALFQFGHSWDAIFCHHLDIAEHASRKEQQACQEQLSNSAKLARQERREDCASWLEDTADLGIEALYTKADLEAKEQDDLERDRTLKGASLHVRFKVKEIEVVRDELEEKESALEAVQEELAKKKDEIKSLKTRLSDSSRAARKQKSEDRSAISGLQVQLQTKKAELRSLDGEIETLNRNMSVIKSNDSQLMDDIDHLEMEVARLTANAQDHVQLINDLQERINEQTQELEKKSAPSQPAVFNFGGSTTHKSSTAQTGAFQFRGGSNTQSAFSFGGFDSKINDAAKDEEIADFKRQLQELSDQNADLKSRNMELGMACVQFTEERGCLLAEKSEYTKQNDLLRQANAALENLVLQNCQSCENCQLMAEECSLKIQEHQNAFQQQVLRYQEQLVTSLNVSAAQSKLIQKLKLENNDCKAIIRREAAVKDIWSKRSLAVQQVDNADEDIINLPVIDQEPVATAILKPALVNLRIAPNAPALQPGYNAMAHFNQHINDNNVWLETMERGVWVHQDKPLFALKMKRFECDDPAEVNFRWIVLSYRADSRVWYSDDYQVGMFATANPDNTEVKGTTRNPLRLYIQSGSLRSMAEQAEVAWKATGVESMDNDWVWEEVSADTIRSWHTLRDQWPQDASIVTADIPNNIQRVYTLHFGEDGDAHRLGWVAWSPS